MQTKLSKEEKKELRQWNEFIERMKQKGALIEYTITGKTQCS